MTAPADKDPIQIGRALSGSDRRPLMTVIDQLYAAAVDPAQWMPFLSSLASMMDADHVFVCRVKDRLRILDYVGLPQDNRDIAPLSKYETLIAEDPRTPIFSTVQGEAVHCRMGVTDASLHASRAYREYLQPLDIEYTMLVIVPAGDGITHDLGLTRGRAGKAFDEGDRERLNELVPHLARAFSIRRTLDERSQLRLISLPANGPHSAETDIDFVRQMFSLSPAQARLAISLVSGQSVQQAAGALGIAESTARQYLKLIFQKTGWRRQVDIVRVVGQALMQR
jgi:DNA-binding CsgD family transcriptional regulator